MSALATVPRVSHCGQPAERIDVAGTSFEALYGVSTLWRCTSCGAAFAPGARRGEALAKRAAELAAGR